MIRFSGALRNKRLIVTMGVIAILILSTLYLIKVVNAAKIDYTRRPLRILFIGNSLTMFNGGVGAELERLFENSDPRLMIIMKSITVGGERLSGHFKNPELHKLIHNGNWDFVVLQEYSNNPISGKEDFIKYSRLFDKEIKKNKAKTLFFITWAYKGNREMTKLIETSYLGIARELKDGTIPVGRAWDRVVKEYPEIEMYHDFKHPSRYGTYFAACCFYSYLTGMDPLNIDPPPYLKKQEAQKLQSVSKEVIDEWKNRKK